MEPILAFSSPIFGDMFLLPWRKRSYMLYHLIVFVSYIRRYVLTLKKATALNEQSKNVFVSYIRRYVLTYENRANQKEFVKRFRLLYSEICSYCQ